jgi:sugar phosphate permease
MNKDLALTATTFGLANSIFYIGYVACEIPSNLLMARYGARVWLARILISWGLASAATMLMVGPNSLYLIRFLVGVLEAGLCPACCSIDLLDSQFASCPRQWLSDDGTAGGDGGSRRVRPCPR